MPRAKTGATPRQSVTITFTEKELEEVERAFEYDPSPSRHAFMRALILDGAREIVHRNKKPKK